MSKDIFQRIFYRGQYWCEDCYRVELEALLAEWRGKIEAQDAEIKRQHALLREWLPKEVPTEAPAQPSAKV